MPVSQKRRAQDSGGDGGKPQHSGLDLDTGPVSEHSIPGWEEEDEVGGGRGHIEGKMIGLENDIRGPGVCEYDSILKNGKGENKEQGFQEGTHFLEVWHKLEQY